MSCTTTGCKRKTYGKDKKCRKCRYEIEKLNPIGLSYRRLKYHAKERGKEFTLTLGDFTEFCHKCEYIAGKGVTKYSYHVDRIDETKGYTHDNIQCLQNTENVKKFLKWNYDQKCRPCDFYIAKSPVVEKLQDYPF